MNQVKPIMKAWIGCYKDAEWIMLVHGETANQAKSRFCRCEPTGDPTAYTDVRVWRLPAWDDKPFVDCPEIRRTFQCDRYDDDGNEVWDSPFINDCRCPLCRKGNPWD